MLMLDLFHELGFSIAVAHVNYQLRGADSDQDAALVQSYCKENNISFYLKKTVVEKGNVQLQAREIRYQWFKELQESKGHDLLLTGHHLNDSLETFLLNLSRGTGLKGLLGVPKETEQVFRPLSDFSREEIKICAIERKLRWREDVSNQSVKYKRNKIRQEITPLLEELHPQFLANFKQTLLYLSAAQKEIDKQIEKVESVLWNKTEAVWRVELLDCEALNDFQLFAVFSPMGFKYPQEIRKLLKSTNSSELTSASYRLLKHKEQLLCKRRVENSGEEKRLMAAYWKKNNLAKVIQLTEIDLPVYLRAWKATDSIEVKGLKGKKKVNKLLRDWAYSKFQKEEVLVLCTAKEEVVCVDGKQVNEKFRKK